jgi:hypothetical protein
MIFAPDGSMRDSFLIQKLAKFCVNPRIVPAPKRAERILIRIAWRSGGLGCNEGLLWQLIDQRNVAIGAPRKPLAIFGFALRTKHGTENKVYYTLSNRSVHPQKPMFLKHFRKS